MFTEVAEGIFRIESVFGGRPLHLYLLRGSNRSVLLDSGASVTPEEVLLEALKDLGPPDLLIVTHPDLDHQGGTPSLREVYPNLTLACGAGDEELVSHPRRLVAERYSAFEYDHGVGFPTEEKPRLLELAGGRGVPVDRTFSGGERLALSEDWVIEIVHIPGHSPGHLGIYDPRSLCAITQDAVQGSDYPQADGSPWALMPTYYDVEPYLRTVGVLESLHLQVLHTGHWPKSEGTGVAQFLKASREYALKADRTVFETLEGGKTRLAEIMDAALPLLGRWDRSAIGDFACSVHGHLQRMIDVGLVAARREDGVVRFEVTAEYREPAG